MDVKKQKTADLYKKINEIVEEIEDLAKSDKKLHEVEKHIFRSLLEIGMILLGYFIQIVSRVVESEGTPVDSEGQKMRNTGIRRRRYRSVFGEIKIARPKHYSATDKTYYALDERLGLSGTVYSYVLYDWVGYGAVDLDFEQSVKYLERILGQELWGMQSSRLTYELSGQVDEFYEAKDWSETPDHSHLSVGFDGKGVPIMRSQTERAKESTVRRLGKGQKKGVKKEATVSLSSSFSPHKRSSSQIIEALFEPHSAKAEQEQEPETKHKWHEEKHVRAFLSDKPRAIEYGIENLLERDTSGTKPIIILIDGDRALRKAVEQVVKKHQITPRVKAYILDFIHVVEYLWKVANAYKGEKDEGREDWVKTQAELLLKSQVQSVIAECRRIQKLKQYTPTQMENINKAITYFENHIDMMKYKTYLLRGYPITTGAVESACGHFVKSRMQRNAMHWGKEGAQNMLNIRAVKKNGDWDVYINEFIKVDQSRLYKMAA